MVWICWKTFFARHLVPEKGMKYRFLCLCILKRAEASGEKICIGCKEEKTAG